ncbi:MAG: hypothetical protein FJ196_03440 [Gammaproteobacteria bacterium]|nr:hypothetical protein [Gammaproteobacteria bacterium]
MGERPERVEYDEEVDLDSAEDLDQVIRDFDQSHRRSPPKGSGDPTWRRLEKMREEKRTADLISDFDNYNIGGGKTKRARGKGSGRR